MVFVFTGIESTRYDETVQIFGVGTTKKDTQRIELELKETGIKFEISLIDENTVYFEPTPGYTNFHESPNW